MSSPELDWVGLGWPVLDSVLASPNLTSIRHAPNSPRSCLVLASASTLDSPPLLSTRLRLASASLRPRLGSLWTQTWYPLPPSRFVLASFLHRLGRDYASTRSRLGLASDSHRPSLESPPSCLDPHLPRHGLTSATLRFVSAWPRSRLGIASIPPRLATPRLASTTHCPARPRSCLGIVSA